MNRNTNQTFLAVLLSLITMGGGTAVAAPEALFFSSYLGPVELTNSNVNESATTNDVWLSNIENESDYDNEVARLDRAIRQAEMIRRTVSEGRNRQAIQEMRGAMRILREFPFDRNLQLAMEAGEDLIQALKNRHYSQRDKIQFAERYSRLFARNVRNSYFYTNNRRGVRTEFVGETDHFRKMFAETKTVDVVGRGGFYRGIQIRAIDDALQVEEVRIRFRNGGESVVGNFHLNEGAGRDILFQNNRRVDSVIIRASSPLFATDAKAEVYGLR